MIITRIEALKGRRYRIYLNDEPAFCLYGTDLAEYPLQENEELSEERLQEICSRVLVKRAKLRAMHLLEKQDRTEWQLRRKLREGEYPPAVIDEALDYVKSFHYIDDRRFAEAYIRDHAASKSPRQMEAELLNKGISGQIISLAFEEAGAADVGAAIRNWMQKKHFDPDQADEMQTRKFMQFLQRRGFAYSDIKEAIRD